MWTPSEQTCMRLIFKTKPRRFHHPRHDIVFPLIFTTVAVAFLSFQVFRHSHHKTVRRSRHTKLRFASLLMLASMLAHVLLMLAPVPDRRFRNRTSETSALRKQAEGLIGKCVVTVQEVPSTDRSGSLQQVCDWRTHCVQIEAVRDEPVIDISGRH